MKVLLPSVKFAFFTWTKVYDIATAIRNLALLNGDMIYKELTPMMFRYTQQNDQNHFGSLAMTLGIVESMILLPNPYKDKYSTI